MTGVNKIKMLSKNFLTAIVIAAVISLLVLSLVFERNILSIKATQAQAAQNSPSYTAFEKLQQEIDNPSGRELNFVSGIVAFPTPITINRDVFIEAVGQPAEFVFDYDNEYPQNDKLISDAQYYPQNRHFVIWADAEAQSVRQPNAYLVVWFKNIIFRAENGFGGIFAPNGNIKLYFENCVFEGLGGENIWGGAMAVASYTSDNYGSTVNSFFQIEINNCTFINNYALCGGAMFAVSHEADELTRVKFQNCLFYNNAATWKNKNLRADNIFSEVYINCVDADFDVESDVLLQIRNGSLPLPVKIGYSFSHWENEAGEPIEFSDNEILEIGQMTLSAVWTPKTFTITYHNIETQSEFPETHIYGQPTVLSIPQKGGYTFIGWLLAGADEPVKFLTLGANDFLDNITMTAIWEVIPPSEPFPTWATALIVVGSITVLAACTFCTLHILRRRKLAPITVGISDTSSVAIPVNTESLDVLAEKYGLTAREKEVALLIVAGKSRTDIASEMFLTVSTVKTHTHNIYSKLEVKSKFELLAKLNQVEKPLIP